MPTYFPNDTQASMINNSNTSTEIWLNFNSFENFSKTSEGYSNKIINSAKSNNISELQFAFKNLNESCKACHRLYRN